MSHCVNLSSEDYILLEEEHKQLGKYLSDIRDTCINLENHLDCQGCGREKHASCRGRFPSFLYRLLETTSKHYSHEEAVLLAGLHVAEKYGYFQVHRQAHIDTIKAVKVVAEACDALEDRALTAEAYRQLYQKIGNLFEEHTHTFDVSFIKPAKKHKLM